MEVLLAQVKLDQLILKVLVHDAAFWKVTGNPVQWCSQVCETVVVDVVFGDEDDLEFVLVNGILHFVGLLLLVFLDLAFLVLFF
jgi:hypothetical protein